MNTSNDEIDLVELFKSIFSFISKNKWILIGVFVLGSAFGYYQSKEKEKESLDIYRTQFIVATPFISGNEIYMIGRELAYNLDKESSDEDLLNSIFEIECLKDVAEGKDTEINMVFKTTSAQDVYDLIQLMERRIQSNEKYKSNYKSKIEQNRELISLVNDQITSITKDKGSLAKDSKQFLTYIELLEKKQTLEKEIDITESPIQSLPIAPLNKIEPGYKFSIATSLGYGIILSIFSALLILFVRLIKMIRA